MAGLAPDWLEYGALGLLTLVLIAWFAQTRTDQARADRTWTFVQTLAQDAINSLGETTEKLQGVLAENTKAMSLLCQKLDGIPPIIEQNGKATRDTVVQNGEATRREIAGLKGPLKRG